MNEDEVLENFLSTSYSYAPINDGSYVSMFNEMNEYYEQFKPAIRDSLRKIKATNEEAPLEETYTILFSSNFSSPRKIKSWELQEIVNTTEHLHDYCTQRGYKFVMKFRVEQMNPEGPSKYMLNFLIFIIVKTHA